MVESHVNFTDQGCCSDVDPQTVDRQNYGLNSQYGRDGCRWWLRHTFGRNGRDPAWDGNATFYPALSLELVPHEECFVPKRNELYFDADQCIVYLGSCNMNHLCSNSIGYGSARRRALLMDVGERAEWLRQLLCLGYMQDHMKNMRVVRTFNCERLIGETNLPGVAMCRNELLEYVSNGSNCRECNEIVADCPREALRYHPWLLS